MHDRKLFSDITYLFIWHRYDAHRDSILRGGDGTAASGNYCGDDGPVDLWKYFSSGCYSGRDDSTTGFFAVYGEVFENIKFSEQNSCEMNSSSALPAFGAADSADADVLNFYAEWSNFVTKLSFSWEDKYNPTEAPNRMVRRAIDKENKKYRDTARKEYIDTVRALVNYVQRRDKRIINIKLEQKRKEDERAAERAQAKAVESARKRDERELRLWQVSLRAVILSPQPKQCTHTSSSVT